MKRATGACGVLLLCTSVVVSAGAAHQPTTLPALTAAGVYDDAFHILSTGDEKDVEAALAQATQVFPNDARLAFFAAACVRSRFEIARAVPLFQKAADLDGNGIWAQAAHSIIGMDMDLGDKQQQFKSLDELSQASPKEPLLLWMVAVQCRAEKKRIGSAKVRDAADNDGSRTGDYSPDLCEYFRRTESLAGIAAATGTGG